MKKNLIKDKSNKESMEENTEPGEENQLAKNMETLANKDFPEMWNHKNYKNSENPWEVRTKYVDSGMDKIRALLFKNKVGDTDGQAILDIVKGFVLIPTILAEQARIANLIAEGIGETDKNSLSEDELLCRLAIRCNIPRTDHHISDPEKEAIAALYTLAQNKNSLSRIFQRSPQSISNIVNNVSHAYTKKH